MSIPLLLVGLLPAGRLKNLLLRVLGPGWSVARSARIHPSVFWRVGVLSVGERAYVGPGNIFRQMVRVELGDQADLGQFNWFSAQARYVEQSDNDLLGCLVLERSAALTSRHYFDCSGGVRLRELAIVGGVRSTFLTHYADVHEWGLKGGPVTIGSASLVFSNCVITAGSTVADRCVVAAGSVVAKSLPEPGKLYAGVPAVAVSDLSEAAFADRSDPRLVSREDARAALRVARPHGRVS